MDAAVTHLRTSGHQIQQEDLAKLSPLEHRNINVLGRYSFTLPDTVSQGRLRPLRESDGIDDLAQLARP